MSPWASWGREPRHFPDLVPLTRSEVAGLTLTPCRSSSLRWQRCSWSCWTFWCAGRFLGMAMRAISCNRPIVPLMGVPVDHVISLTFAIGSAMAAAGGLLYGLAYPVLDP